MDIKSLIKKGESEHIKEKNRITNKVDVEKNQKCFLDEAK